MNEKRKIALVAKRVSFEEAEDADVEFWANKSIKERLEEMLEWNKKVWTNILGYYPSKIERVGGKRLKNETDEDDF